jgi:hypothetical protein
MCLLGNLWHVADKPPSATPWLMRPCLCLADLRGAVQVQFALLCCNVQYVVLLSRWCWWQVHMGTPAGGRGGRVGTRQVKRCISTQCYIWKKHILSQQLWLRYLHLFLGMWSSAASKSRRFVGRMGVGNAAAGLQCATRGCIAARVATPCIYPVTSARWHKCNACVAL